MRSWELRSVEWAESAVFCLLPAPKAPSGCWPCSLRISVGPGLGEDLRLGGGFVWEIDLAMEEGLSLLDFKHDIFLSQKVREPTRGANVLDLIFCSEDDLVSDVVVGECLAGSDHYMVWCTVGSNVGPEIARPRDQWKLRWADYDGFRRDLLEMPRPVEGSSEDMGSSFRTQYLTIQQRRIPRKRVGGTERVQPSWFHGGIVREVRKWKRFLPCGQEQPLRTSADCIIIEGLSRKWCNRRRLLKSTE